MTVVENVCIHMKHHFDRTDFKTKAEHIYSRLAIVFSYSFKQQNCWTLVVHFVKFYFALP